MNGLQDVISKILGSSPGSAAPPSGVPAPAMPMPAAPQERMPVGGLQHISNAFKGQGDGLLPALSDILGASMAGMASVEAPRTVGSGSMAKAFAQGFSGAQGNLATKQKGVRDRETAAEDRQYKRSRTKRADMRADRADRRADRAETRAARASKIGEIKTIASLMKTMDQTYVSPENRLKVFDLLNKQKAVIMKPYEGYGSLETKDIENINKQMEAYRDELMKGLTGKSQLASPEKYGTPK